MTRDERAAFAQGVNRGFRASGRTERRPVRKMEQEKQMTRDALLKRLNKMLEGARKEGVCWRRISAARSRSNSESERSGARRRS